MSLGSIEGTEAESDDYILSDKLVLLEVLSPSTKANKKVGCVLLSGNVVLINFRLFISVRIFSERFKQFSVCLFAVNFVRNFSTFCVIFFVKNCYSFSVVFFCVRQMTSFYIIFEI